MQQGNPGQQGATPLEDGVNFAIFSSVADSVELCLFDEQGNETARHELPGCDDHIWHGFLPGCKTGQRYGYRIHGDYEPGKGARCNPHKLLLDPYARRIEGDFQWHDTVFDHVKGRHGQITGADTRDSAPYVPKSVVVADFDDPIPTGPRISWANTIFYEANVRGYTMRHPALDESQRGRFSGMGAPQVIEHIKSLGITSLELMPVQAFIDEHHLAKQDLRNYWGYNTISFFAPMPRFGLHDPVQEFRDMVRHLHDAGIEVILDVAYNHTGESDGHGPTLSFRGIDNLAYYRTVPHHPYMYINDTGTGNTVNADHPQVQQLVVDSLRYWTTHMGVDGFRFDLAAVLGRHDDGFSTNHPLLSAITDDLVLKNTKLIAEPWDPGPGGYQLGGFPPGWGEWNDKFRDTARRFWRGDHGVSGELAQRIHGSADLFDNCGREPSASVNFITAHDGFTLQDLVSYEHRHNLPNGENNRDGHAHNFSCNYGVEGETDDEEILEFRREHRLNLLATMLFSQGTPMLLAGDEMSHTQNGNNNAYAQDNETTWLDWSSLFDDEEYLNQVKKMLQLRRELPLLRQNHYVHGKLNTGFSVKDIEWLDIDGMPMKDHSWADASAFAVAYYEDHDEDEDSFIIILINRDDEPARISLPSAIHGRDWEIAFSTHDQARAVNDRLVGLAARSVVLVRNS